jgi:hypothetical protein
MNKAGRLAGLILLLLMANATLRHHDNVGHSDDVAHMELIQKTMLSELNTRPMGRLPYKGFLGGMINNIWAAFSGQSETLGCGGQASLLYAKLNDGMPGWRFEMRYEVGRKSPILLPHQWVTAHGPHGQIVNLDAWADTIYSE